MAMLRDVLSSYRSPRCGRAWALLASVSLAACQHAAPAHAGDAAAGDAAAADASPRPLPVLATTSEVCKLLNDRNISDPTANDVQHRANVLGADLGIPVETGGRLYFLFGDTIGYAGIWGGGESHPDAVGYAVDPAANLGAHPELVCGGLGILTLPAASSIGPTVDPSVTADFAAGAMTAPAGHALSEYIHNPAGGGTSHFANLPGDFEVPSGAFAAGGAIYLLYTTVVSPGDVRMAGSYLARWAAPATSGVPSYDIQYAVDERFDTAGPLLGDFINIAAETSGDYVYLFGTGEYRASAVHLARKRLDALATPGGFERFDAATGVWISTGPAAPIIAAPGYGETSVRYFAAIGRWVFLAEEQVAGANRIVARFADRPEGPWSDAIVLHDMADAGFRAQYCCAPDNACAGAELMNCDRTGFYGSYLLPELEVDADGFTLTYTLSSFDPYNVALFRAHFTQGV
jgi:Domain of unknown function (DUF4185)